MDLNALKASHSVGKNELRQMGKMSGAKTAGQAISANNSAKSSTSPIAFGNAFLGSNYSASTSTGSNCSSKGVSASSGIGNFQKTGNPDQDAQNYAKQKGISVNQAKEELKAQYGDPQKPQQGQA